jgi:hypothetical protein
MTKVSVQANHGRSVSQRLKSNVGPKNLASPLAPDPLFHRMPQFLKPLAVLVFTLTLWLVIAPAVAQPVDSPRILHISGAIAADKLTLSWPVSPGHWQLTEQQPAFTGEWRVIPTELYSTNAEVVSVVVPLPAQESLFRLKRFVPLPKGFTAEPPPFPANQTNRTRPAKLPAHP